MTPEEYERLTELFHAALGMETEDRDAFLNQLSLDDASLRTELQSLLAVHSVAISESPLDDIAAGYLAQSGEALGQAPSFGPNTHLNHFVIRWLLGKGGMGEVYLAEDVRLHRTVALKILPANLINGPDRMRRFEQEATAAAALNHPHIAQVYEIGESENAHFIVMEHIDGDTLRNRIHRDKDPLPVLLRYLTQVASGLAKAHEAGIVHRDLKPDNIMIARDGYAKILDFGLAKLVDANEPHPVNDASETKVEAQHSTAGLVMGTAGYMSPEQAMGKGQKIDQRSDIFSFGCVLFEASAGRKAFEGKDALDSLHKIVHAPTPLIRETNPDAPDELQRIVHRCLAKDPEERYQTIKDVVQELREVRLAITSAGEIQSKSHSEPSVTTSRAQQLINQIKSPSRIALMALSLLVVAAAALAYAFYFNNSRTPALTEQDTILIADFDNKTGDEVFDGTLKQALAVQLEQSPFLDIYSDERVREALRFMSRSPDERVTRDVAKEICLRQGLKAMLAGSIAPLGRHYVISVEAINAQTGDVLVREQIEAESKEQVLSALGRTATRLREKLGESLSMIRKFDAQMEATTPSLEALKAYSAGRELHLRGKVREAIPILKTAVALDPNFAKAYGVLAAASQAAGETQAARGYTTKAFELRERASERERLWIATQYYLTVSGELEQARESVELLKQIYPRYASARNQLSFVYASLGDYEKGMAEVQEAIRLAPNWALLHVRLAIYLRYLGRLAEARESLNRASAKVDAPFVRFEQYANAYLQADTGDMQRQVDWFRDKPDDVLFLGLQMGTADVSGQYRKAREFQTKLVEQRKRLNHTEAAATDVTSGAQRNALVGHCRLVSKDVAEGLAIARVPAALRTAALALALCGDTGKAQAIADEYGKVSARDTLANAIYLPIIRAAIAHRRGNHAEAIELLKTLQGSERADSSFIAHYIRGQAFLAQHKGAEAAGEFQYILDHRGFAPFSLLYPLAQLGLARAAVATGDQARARQAYQDSLTLWKDADADLPVLIEAKTEYEKLGPIAN